MANTQEIIEFCSKYLQVDKWNDYCINGLQVAGREKIGKIITGVSLSQELIETAIKKKAQMIMVHHGIFKNDLGIPVEIKGIWKKRLQLLLGS